MPHVQITMLKGRTLEQKRKLAARVTDALEQECGARREADSGDPTVGEAKLEAQLTRGEFEVFDVGLVDEAAKLAYFTANAGDDRQRQLFPASTSMAAASSRSRASRGRTNPPSRAAASCT